MPTDAPRGGDTASPAAAAPRRWEQRRLTPMLEQYVAAKREVGSALLLFRMGDFFELFFEDAEIAARELELTLTARDKGDDPIPMAGVPHHAIDNYVARLVGRGYCVALCDQVEDPRQAKGIVRREITRLITPGTLSDLEALEPTQTRYLAAAAPLVDAAEDGIALVLLDLLAGELLCTRVDSLRALGDELMRMGVRELLLEPAWHAQAPQQAFGRACVQQGVTLSAWPDTSSAAPTAVPAAPPGEAVVRRAWQQALGAVVAYAQSSQRRTLGHLMAPRSYALSEALVLDEATRRSLELTATQMHGRKEGALLHHLDCTTTAMGARLLARWLLMPLRRQDAIAKRADAVEMLVNHPVLRERMRTALRTVYDIERLAGRVALERATPRDLAALGRSLAALPQVRDALLEHDAPGARPALVMAWRKLPLLEALAETLRTALIELPPTTHTEGGIFVAGHCAELDELLLLCTDAQAQIDALEAQERQATGIASLKVRYNRVFGYYIEVTRAHLTQVPAHYVRRQTLAQAERYTTAALGAFEAKVLGAKHKRVAREAQLFEQLVGAVRAQLVALKDIAREIATTDALISLAEVAHVHRYVRPTLSEKPVLALVGSRHPVLEARMPTGEPFVPNDIRLDAAGQQLMLLTGPNMAGKSTLMRQVALSVIMAQMGGFVAATQATIGLCDRLYTRVGAQDHLGGGQSTFMVEMCETARILRGAGPHSLVLLDEVGRGTSTYDGVSIAWAVAEHLHDSNGCRTLFATHYHELTALAQTHARIVNARMAIAEQGESIVFLRQLELGAAQRSYGIEVARLAALPPRVLRRARSLLETLEARAQAQAPVPAPANKPPTTAQVCGHNGLIGLLGDIDIDATTPIEALSLLARLKEHVPPSTNAPAPARRPKAKGRAPEALLPFGRPIH